jgi:hypothetical protein
VKTESGELQDLMDKTEMERAMMMNKEDKLRQSYHTPFYQRPLTSEFGYKGTTQAAATVLAGVYDTNHHLDPHVRDMLNHLQMPKSIQELGKLLEDYQRYWRKANENISLYSRTLVLFHDESRSVK